MSYTMSSRDLANAQQALNEAVAAWYEHYHWVSFPKTAENDRMALAFQEWDKLRQNLAMPVGGSGRSTSIAAGHVNLHSKESLRRNIVFAIVAKHAQFGTGMTIAELKGQLRKEHSSVSAALSALVKLEWLKDSGVKRNTQHGRPAIVWEPTQLAIDKCRETALEVADGS